MSTRRFGGHAEDVAEAFLRLNGYAILARNYSFHRHEIDIVAETRGRVVFVEVKCRSGYTHGTPGQAVGRDKMRRIVHAARGFLAERGLSERPVRFDVVEVLVTRGGLGLSVGHIVSAFGGDLRGW